MIWKLAETIPTKIRAELKEYDDLTAQLLYNRNITTQDAAKSFFSAGLSEITPREHLKDLKKAVSLILDAVKSGEKIYIYGDYDVDGVCASSILFDFLYRELKADVIPYIPSRFEEGYGMNSKALGNLLEQGANLIITVDCGIRDGELVEEFSKKGLKFIITDHHEPPESGNSIEKLTNHALAVVHPMLSREYEFKGICATTVIWRVVEELSAQAKAENLISREFLPEKYLDLVALATVCDVMPLVEENRILLKAGLAQMRQTENLGLRELLSLAGVISEDISPYHLGYVIGPRLNAAGRLESALDAVRLLTSTSPELTRAKAKQLSDLNSQRQLLTGKLLEQAEQKLLEWGTEKKLIFIAGENWPEGIVGLVAGRLCEKYHKPTIVCSKNGEFAVGSCRSISGFHITDAIEKSEALLERFGGHAMAAGFTISNNNIDQFSQKTLKLAEQSLSDIDLEKVLNIDAELLSVDITGETIAKVEAFAPFGFGNKQPVFQIKSAKLLSKKLVGSSGDHLKLRVGLDGIACDVIGFGKAEYFTELEIGTNYDLAGNLDENTFLGNTTVQLKLQDIKPSEHE